MIPSFHVQPIALSSARVAWDVDQPLFETHKLGINSTSFRLSTAIPLATFPIYVFFFFDWGELAMLYYLLRYK